jgi:cyclopropane fatty-acyl-phospholipid synthase-like methyltransferase
MVGVYESSNLLFRNLQQSNRDRDMHTAESDLTSEGFLMMLHTTYSTMCNIFSRLNYELVEAAFAKTDMNATME